MNSAGIQRIRRIFEDCATTASSPKSSGKIMKFTSKILFCCMLTGFVTGCRHTSRVMGVYPEATQINGVAIGIDELSGIADSNQAESPQEQKARFGLNRLTKPAAASPLENLVEASPSANILNTLAEDDAEPHVEVETRLNPQGKALRDSPEEQHDSFIHRGPQPLDRHLKQAVLSAQGTERDSATSIRTISLQDRSDNVQQPENAAERFNASAGDTLGFELTLLESEQLAIEHNPAIRQAAATFQKSKGAARQVTRFPNPTIGYSGQEIGDQGTAGIQGGFIQQTIIGGRKLKWNKRVANWDIQSQLWQVEAQRFRVRNDVRRAYYDVLGATKKLALIRDLEQIAEAGAKNAQALNDAMEAAVPDVLQAEVQLSEVRILRQNTIVAHKAAWNQLANLIGQSGTPPKTLQDTLADAQPKRDVETAWQQLVNLSPEVRAADAEIQRARNQIEREKVQAIPNASLQVGAVHLNTSGDDAANVSVGLPVPLFNRNKGNIDRATAEYQRQVWNRKRLLSDLQTDLIATMSSYQQALTRVDTFRDEIIPRQTRTLKLVEAAYPTQFDFLRLLTTRRDYFKSRLDYLDALVNLRHAEVALDGLLLSGALDSPADTSLDASNRSNIFNSQ